MTQTHHRRRSIRSQFRPNMPNNVKQAMLVHPKQFAVMRFGYEKDKVGDDDATVHVSYLRTGHELPQQMWITPVRNGNFVEFHYTDITFDLPHDAGTVTRLKESDIVPVKAILARGLWDTLLLDGWIVLFDTN